MSDIKLICFDIDGTLIEGNSWYTLNTALGVTPKEDLELHKAYSTGLITYTDWLTTLETLYRKRGKTTPEQITTALSTYTLGTRC